MELAIGIISFLIITIAPIIINNLFINDYSYAFRSSGEKKFSYFIRVIINSLLILYVYIGLVYLLDPDVIYDKFNIDQDTENLTNFVMIFNMIFYAIVTRFVYLIIRYVKYYSPLKRVYYGVGAVYAFLKAYFITLAYSGMLRKFQKRIYSHEELVPDDQNEKIPVIEKINISLSFIGLYLLIILITIIIIPIFAFLFFIPYYLLYAGYPSFFQDYIAFIVAYVYIVFQVLLNFRSVFKDNNVLKLDKEVTKSEVEKHDLTLLEHYKDYLFFSYDKDKNKVLICNKEFTNNFLYSLTRVSDKIKENSQETIDKYKKLIIDSKKIKMKDYYKNKKEMKALVKKAETLIDIKNKVDEMEKGHNNIEKTE